MDFQHQPLSGASYTDAESKDWLLNTMFSSLNYNS